MITFVRTGAIAPGKGAAAIAFAQKVAAYWRDSHDREIDLLRPVAGNPGRIGFVGRYKDLAEFDSFAMKSQADSEYMQLLASAADLFVAGSIHDEIWRSL